MQPSPLSAAELAMSRCPCFRLVAVDPNSTDRQYRGKLRGKFRTCHGLCLTNELQLVYKGTRFRDAKLVSLSDLSQVERAVGKFQNCPSFQLCLFALAVLT